MKETKKKQKPFSTEGGTILLIIDRLLFIFSPLIWSARVLCLYVTTSQIWLEKLFHVN